MPAQSFADKYGPWALVAGASEGLGAAFSSELAARGLNLVLIARRPEALDRLAADLRARNGVDVRTAAIDLGRADLTESVRTATAGLDIGLLVYNAAYSEIGPFVGQDVAGKLRMLDVNCRAPLVLSDALARPMVARGRGGIVLVASMAGLQGSALVAVYAATKAFNIVLGEGLWEELRAHGIDVLSLVAGATSTPNFHRSEPRIEGLFAPPIMTADVVAREGLDALGRGPRAIAGRGNRLALLVMERFLTRRTRIKIMGRATRRMYRARLGP
jgi:short-subunit dehydrogenase